MRRRTLIALAAALAPFVAAAPAAASEQSFLVFFQPWSAELDDPAKEVITAAASAARSNPAAQIEVRGYASTIGGRQANLYLSLTRAEVVNDAMVEAGIPTVRIRPRGAGAVAFVADPQANRRVDIVIHAP